MPFLTPQEMHERPPPPSFPQAVDTHLIMNAMNQIAARDISINGTENPLLFALSDYLRESLSRLDVDAVSIRTDVRLAEAHLMLHACVAHSDIQLDVSGVPVDFFKVTRGTLPVLAIGCLKALRLSPQVGWRMHIVFEPVVKEDEWVAFSMTISAEGRPFDSDLGRAISFLQSLIPVKTGAVLFDILKSNQNSKSVTLAFRARIFY